jgi:hypothetical protein
MKDSKTATRGKLNLSDTAIRKYLKYYLSDFLDEKCI